MTQGGFFNAVDGDRTYNADDFNDFFDGIISENGVYKKSGDALEVVAGDGMSVNISTGRMRIQSHFFVVSSIENLTIEASDVVNPRCDAVMIRYNETDRTITPVVLTGTPASVPVVPSPVRVDGIYDMCLAYVYVPANSSSIIGSNIQDKRNDGSVCGYAKLLIDAIDAGIEQYTSLYGVGASKISTIPINIEEYDSDNDILEVNINGVVLNYGIDYTVTGTGSQAAIVTQYPVQPGNVLFFKVIKAVITVI